MSKRYCVVTASIEEDFFEQVEEAREKTGQSRRQFVIDALEHYLKYLEQSDNKCECECKCKCKKDA